MLEALFTAIGTGIIVGVVAWGGLKVELRAHHRDIDRAQATADLAHERINSLHP